MTLDDLCTTLADADPDAALIFSTEQADIRPGYHLTEFKLTRGHRIDCSGQVEDVTDASAQLLDGWAGHHMKVGRFLRIASKSSERLTGLGSEPLVVEFSPKNSGLEHFSIDNVVVGDAVRVELSPMTAVCRPMAAACTGRAAKASSCC